MLVSRNTTQILFRNNFRCMGFIPNKFTNALHSLDNEEKLIGGATALPHKAKVVICGGGVIGAAVAYHLSKRGWGDNTVLIEKEE